LNDASTRDAAAPQTVTLGSADVPAKINCASLGAQITAVARTFGGPKGAIVSAVVAHGAADRAGIRRGDVVLRAGNTEIYEPADVQAAMAEAVVGSAVDIKVMRKARAVDVSVQF
jgi:S1-C subfamily serine protease